MWRKAGAIAFLVLLVTITSALPARAVVVGDLLTHHPLVALWSNSGWGAHAEKISTRTSATVNDPASLLSPEAQNVPMPTDISVSPDNMTVEIVPIRLHVPTYVVFAVYLVGAILFYTLLVLVASPGPVEYY